MIKKYNITYLTVLFDSNRITVRNTGLLNTKNMGMAHNSNALKYIKVGYEIKHPWHVGDSSDSLSTAHVIKTLQKWIF